MSESTNQPEQSNTTGLLEQIAIRGNALLNEVTQEYDSPSGVLETPEFFCTKISYYRGSATFTIASSNTGENFGSLKYPVMGPHSSHRILYYTPYHNSPLVIFFQEIDEKWCLFGDDDPESKASKEYLLQVLAKQVEHDPLLKERFERFLTALKSIHSDMLKGTVKYRPLP